MDSYAMTAATADEPRQLLAPTARLKAGARVHCGTPGGSHRGEESNVDLRSGMHASRVSHGTATPRASIATVAVAGESAAGLEARLVADRTRPAIQLRRESPF